MPRRPLSTLTDRARARGASLQSLALQALTVIVILTCLFGTPCSRSRFAEHALAREVQGSRNRPTAGRRSSHHAGKASRNDPRPRTEGRHRSDQCRRRSSSQDARERARLLRGVRRHPQATRQASQRPLLPATVRRRRRRVGLVRDAHDSSLGHHRGQRLDGHRGSRHRHEHPVGPRRLQRTTRAGLERADQLQRHQHEPVPRNLCRRGRRAEGGQRSGQRRRTARSARSCRSSVGTDSGASVVEPRHRDHLGD